MVKTAKQLIKSRSENTNLSGAFRMDIPVISFLWIDSGISRKVFIISMQSICYWGKKQSERHDIQ